MLKCKCCKKSVFGAILKETKKTPIMMQNGEPVKVLSDKVETENEIMITYCMTCKKEIDQEKDLYELETCQVCGNEFDELENGVCHKCNEAKKKLENMSKDDLLLMLLKQQMASGNVNTVSKKKKVEEQTEEEPKEEVGIAASMDEDVDINNIADEDIEILNEIDNVELNLNTYDEDNGDIF